MTDQSDVQDQVTLEFGGHKIKLRNYVTGADEEAIMQVTTAAMKTTITGEGADAKSTTEVDAGMTQKLERLKIERFVDQFDDATNPATISELVYNLRLTDFRKLVEHLNELTKDVSPDPNAKKKS